MLTRIRVAPYGSSSPVDLNYGVDSLAGGYDLISVDGLEPPLVDVNHSKYALLPGGRFHSASTDVRNIVMRVGLKPAPGSGKTVQDMRRDLFHAIPAGERLLIRLWNKGVYELAIDGYLEKIESDYFSKESELKISIICVDPYFRSPAVESRSGLVSETITVINNGDIPAGFTVNFTATQPFQHPLTIHNDTTGDSITVMSSWSTGVRLRIVTLEGPREVTKRNASNGIIEHLLGSTEVNGGWPMLVRGENQIRASSPASASIGYWTWDISHRHYYGGF